MKRIGKANQGVALRENRSIASRAVPQQTTPTGRIDAEMNQEEYGSDNLMRMLSLAGIKSSNPASPAYDGDIIDTEAEVVKPAEVGSEWGYEEEPNGEIEFELPVPGGKVEIEFEPDPETPALGYDGSEYDIDGECCDDEDFVNVIDRDHYRDMGDDMVDSDGFDDNMDVLVDMDEDADDDDYGHNTVPKRGKKHEYDVYGHRSRGIDADKADKYRGPRSGSNAMANPVNKMVECVTDADDSLSSALNKVMECKASDMNESEIVAMTNAFISLLESDSPETFAKLHNLYQEANEADYDIDMEAEFQSYLKNRGV